MDYAKIEEIVSVLRHSRLTEMEVRQGGATLRLRRPAGGAPGSPTGAAVLPVLQTEAETLAAGDGAPLPATVAVTAALVGIFQPLPEPIVEGALVAEREVLGQIESMRLMNDCPAPAAGRVIAVRVEEGQPVEYGQPLFEIQKEEAE